MRKSQLLNKISHQNRAVGLAERRQLLDGLLAVGVITYGLLVLIRVQRLPLVPFDLDYLAIALFLVALSLWLVGWLGKTGERWWPSSSRIASSLLLITILSADHMTAMLPVRSNVLSIALTFFVLMLVWASQKELQSLWKRAVGLALMLGWASQKELQSLWKRAVGLAERGCTTLTERPSVVTAALLLVYLAIRLWLNRTWIGNDEGNMVYDAKLIAEGYVPFRDFVARGTPLIYFYALFVKLFGANIYVIKTVNAFLSTAIVYVIYLIGTALHSRRAGLLAALLYVLSPIVLTIQTLILVFVQTGLPVSLGAYFFIKSEATSYRRPLFLSGLFLSLSFFTAASSLPFMLSLPLVLGLCRYRRGILDFARRLGYYLAGILVPALAIFGFYTWHLGFPAGVWKPLDISEVGQNMPRLSSEGTIYNWTLGTTLSTYLLALALVALIYIFMTRRSHLYFAGLLLAAWFFSALSVYIWYSFQVGFFNDYTIEFMSPLSLLAALFVTEINKVTLDRQMPKTVNLLTALLVIFSLVSIPIEPVQSSRGTVSYGSIFGSGIMPDTLEKVTRYLKPRVKPNDEIAAWALQYPLQAGCRQLMDISHPLIYDGNARLAEAMGSYSRADIIEHFATRNVKYVVEDGLRPAFPFLDDIRDLTYRLVTMIDEVRIYKRVNDDAFAKAARFVQEHHQDGDIVVSSSMWAKQFLGKYDYFAMQKDYKKYILIDGDQMVDMGQGAPLLSDVRELRNVLSRNQRVWLLAVRGRLTASFMEYVKSRMTLVYQVGTVEVYVSDKTEAWPAIERKKLGVLLANGSFEDRDGDGLPDGWDTLDWKGSTQVYGLERKDGRDVARIEKTNESGGAAYVQYLPLFPGQQYHLRGYAKGAESRIYIEYWDNRWQYFNNDIVSPVESGLFTPSLDWQSFSFEFTAPLEAATARVALAITGPGTAWFRDVALEEAQVYEEKDPSGSFSANGFIELGDIYRSDGDSETAEKAYMKAILLDPEASLAYTGLGDLSLDKGSAEEAISWYKRAVAVGTRPYDVHLRFGDLYRSLGRAGDAATQYKLAASIAPEDPWIRLRLGDLAKGQGQTDQAVNYYKEAISLNPKLVWGYQRLGEMAMDKGDLATARQYYEKALSLNPKFSSALVRLGDIVKEQGRTEEATQYYQKAIETDPGQFWGYLRLAEISRANGDVEKAKSYYKQAASLDPRSPYAFVALGDIYRNTGEMNKAIAQYEKAAQVAPNMVWPYVGLGECYRSLDRLEKAEDMYKRAIQIDPNNFWAHFGLAQTLQAQGRTSEAIAQYQEALKIDPSNTWAQNALKQLQP
ncbi:MAG: tetratricopeptide repeat protein [Chloroflexi bacterium]|nr:tetratricopeptide repeat protein [Chloroflexota bacterium]MCL5075291.1 tetratricopeptide repeat protein [Chloroflexota bacterium]